MYGNTHTTTRGGWRFDAASDRQIAAITRELPRRQIADDERHQIEAQIAAGAITKGQASDALDALFAAPFMSARPAAATGTVTVAGFYRLNGAVYRVQESKTNKGRFYAKAVTAHGWDYAAGKGVIYRLTAADMMTGEEIAAFGVESGICANCSAVLDDPISKAVGLGPVCGPRVWGEGYRAARKAAAADPQVAAQVAAIKAAAAS